MRIRRVSMARDGSPERSTRRASVLTSIPTVPWSSGRSRPATGKPIGEWQRQPAAPPAYRFATILLSPPREALYAACDARFAAIIAAGGIAEAAALLARGLSPDLPAMKAVGVPELFSHLHGDTSLTEAIAAAQQSTRRYAKRQMTWFRHQLDADLTCVEQYSESFLHCSRHFIDRFLLTR